MQPYHRIFMRLMSIVLLTAAVGSSGFAQQREFPPGIQWKQLETEHFIILFDDNYRDAAATVQTIAEPIHQQVTGLLRYAPKEKTYLILTDHVDTSNGYASVLPQNKIALFLHEPGAGDAFFGLRSPDWLKMVLTHEYTHIVQMDMHNGIYKFGRKIFGHIMLPNVGLPMWMIEGLAVYTETKWQDGRGYHPYYDMMMRADVLADDFKTLDQMAALGLRKWPMGSIVYLYGYFFNQYLADTYGEAKVIDLSLHNSGNFPIFGGNIFKQVYAGKTAHVLWQEWRNVMYQRYTDQLAKLRANPVTATRPLTTAGYGTRSPIFSPDGQYVYYLEMGPYDVAAIVQQRLSDGHLTRLAEQVVPDTLSLSADGQRLYFGKADLHRTFYLVSDLYELDIAHQNVRRLTHGLRALDPTIAPDGKTLVFTTTKGGSMSLMRLDLATKAVTPLIETADHTQFGQPVFSSDGRRLAVQIWKEGGFQDIYVLNSDGSNLQALTFDRAMDSGPSWEMQDQYIFFSSDRTSVPNIFAYSLAEEKLYQVTNVLTGAFNPDVSSDGSQLVLELYSHNGLDIHTAKLQPETWLETAYTLENAPASQATSQMVLPAAEETNYHPFASLLPTFWMPDYAVDEDGYKLGVTTIGQDALAEHWYQLAVYYGLNSERIGWFGEYVNNQFTPTFTLFGQDRENPFFDIFQDTEGDDTTFWQREQTAGLSVSFPLYQTNQTSLALITGYRYKKISAVTELSEITPSPDEGVLSGVAAGLMLQNLDASAYAISPERGMALSLMYRRDDQELGSDFDLDTVVGDLRMYVNVPKLRNHVLAIRTTGGMSDGQTLRQGVFQVGGFTLDEDLAGLNRQQFFLRGYEFNVLAGNRFALGSVEYRFPLWYPQRGLTTFLKPFMDSLVGAVFYDIGNAWDGETDLEDFKQGVGGELRLNIGLQGGALPMTLRVGYAYGLDEDIGQSQVMYGFNFNFWL